MSDFGLYSTMLTDFGHRNGGNMTEDFSRTLKRFNYIKQGIDEQYHIIAQHLDLSDSAFNILYVLYQEGDGVSQSAIYRATGMSRKTAGSSFKKMQQNGILEIRKGSGRGNTIFLTGKGHDMIHEKIAPVVNAENSLFDSWNEQDRETIIRLENRYLTEITEKFEELRK